MSITQQMLYKPTEYLEKANLNTFVSSNDKWLLDFSERIFTEFIFKIKRQKFDKMCAIKFNILKTVGACEWLTFRGTVLTYAAKKKWVTNFEKCAGK